MRKAITDAVIYAAIMVPFIVFLWLG